MSEKTTSKAVPEKEICGIIMPISPVEGCAAEHWKHVKAIISKAITDANLTPRMVNESEETAIIHRNIVTNIYSDPLVVCDISHRNPNVMLELGMRLAFGKHVVIVKDDKTLVPFDAGVIEYVEYPRDLRYPLIEDFIAVLSEKVRNTYVATKNKEKSVFLEYFKEIKAPILKGEEMSLPEYLEREFANVNAKINKLAQRYELNSSQRNMRDDNIVVRKREEPPRGLYEDYLSFCQKMGMDPC